MKRVGHIWSTITSVDNCREAVVEEAKTQRIRRRGKTEATIARADAIAKDVRKKLLAGFRATPSCCFTVIEGGKKRNIRTYNVFDSICIRAIVRVVEPIIYARMSPHSYCPIKGRGPLRMARAISKAIRKEEYANKVWMKTHPKATRRIYCLKTDIHHFFASITAESADAALRRWIKDEWVLEAIVGLIRDADELPIGTAYSAMVANAVMIDVDWHMASFAGVLGYWRYMDDVMMIFRSKEKARGALAEYARLLAEHGLSFANKWQIFRANRRPIVVGGFKIRSSGIHIAGRIACHISRIFGRAIRRGWRNLTMKEMYTIASLYGWIKTTNSYSFQRKWRNLNGETGVFQRIGLAARA